tara:strand:+ start:121 stop:618 length:498 start_codon:yes stop_codon:yes gene_type:complete
VREIVVTNLGMEFLLYLNSKEKEILELVYKAQYKVEENTPLCFLGDRYFGFLKKRQKTIVICTDNAKKLGGVPRYRNNYDREDGKTGIIIRRAIRHESVHVAQACNNSNLLNMLQSKDKVHKWYKKKALEGSTRLSKISKEREYEAYLMEDNPKLVIAALKKFCF